MSGYIEIPHTWYCPECPEPHKPNRASIGPDGMRVHCDVSGWSKSVEMAHMDTRVFQEHQEELRSEKLNADLSSLRELFSNPSTAPESMTLLRSVAAEYAQGEHDRFTRLFGDALKHLEHEMVECGFRWLWKMGESTLSHRGEALYQMLYQADCDLGPTVQFYVSDQTDDPENDNWLSLKITPLVPVVGEMPHMWCMSHRARGRAEVREVVGMHLVVSKMIVMLSQFQQGHWGLEMDQADLGGGVKEGVYDASMVPF